MSTAYEGGVRGARRGTIAEGRRSDAFVTPWCTEAAA